MTTEPASGNVKLANGAWVGVGVGVGVDVGELSGVGVGVAVVISDGGGVDVGVAVESEGGSSGFVVSVGVSPISGIGSLADA